MADIEALDSRKRRICPFVRNSAHLTSNSVLAKLVVQPR